MSKKALPVLLILLFIQTLTVAGDLYVPSRDYPTIQSAINAASGGDVVIVSPDTYTGTGNVDLDFNGKAITVRSQINPANPNPDIIAATIIDCQGDRYNPRRAFHFHNGEGSDSKVLGFTIINGYARGPKGTDGQFGYIGDPLSSFDPVGGGPGVDVNTLPPRALSGADVVGNGYGGGILCEGGSSPTIRYCVITDCTVTGAQGGNGADGLWGPWQHWTLGDEDPCNPGQIDPEAEITDNSNGQWGGYGGDGSGNGYGGAIACIANSNPIISDCIINNNFARGGQGGDGGNGGNADPAGGNESGGGDAGDSIGDGIGGGIYADASSPIITNCTFSNNIATTGARGTGGQRGLGDETDPRAPEGQDSFVFSTGEIAGGAAWYGNNSNANFTNCTFTSNEAYEAYVFYNPLLGEDISNYTVGGALYSDLNNSVNLDTCEFISNRGGAVDCNSGCNLDFNDCLFTDNSETTNGGALNIESGATVDIHNSIFSNNSAYDDGGAVKCRSNAVFTNCSFSGNRADDDNDGYGYGGAIDLYQPGTTLTINADKCSFTGNQSIIGGGLSSENFVATFTDCYFMGNTASNGGGLDMVNGDLTFTAGAVSGNNATDGHGGGLNCSYTITEIRDCTISNNSADGVYPTSGDGGAINLYGGAGNQEIFNCLIVGNSAAVDGGAIACGNASPDIGNCTFSDNSAGGYGGAVFSDYLSGPDIIDSIFRNNNNHAIHEEDSGGDAIVRYSLFYNNPDGDYYDSGTGMTYSGPGQVGSIPGGSNNRYGAPLFESGPLGGFYLNQTSSPAVDNGSGTAASLGLDSYTTDAANAPDSGQVDMGYHYIDIAGAETFQLTATVTAGQGTIEPQTGDYYAGALVTLTANPQPGWYVKAWSGTNDDSSTAKTNSVIMNSDKTVTVEFRQPKTLIVAVGGGGQGYYVNITDALHDAEDGDTIVVYPGVYYGPQIQVNKNVEIRSQHPDDPDWVEQTIIDSTGHAGPAFWFYSDRDSSCILNGLTIQNSTWYTTTGDDGDNPGENGEEGPGAAGGAIYIVSGASPTIKNCLIRDNSILGGYGGTGSNADETHNAGRGGWGGWAYGGAIYCGTNSSPEFINCRIIDNQAVGGIGGNGGDWDPTGGRANYGGNWSRAEWWNINPQDLTVEFVQGDLWEVWVTTLEVDPYITGGPYIGDYRWYSGYGGGVFIDTNSTVTFEDCTISGNLAQGGMSGLGGEEPGSGPTRAKPWPLQYEIPSFGGGVYCAADSNVTFTGCTIMDNVSSEPLFDHIANSGGYGDGALGGWLQEEYDPCDTYSIDPYLGHGGGVCAEDTASVKFIGCNLSGNKASVGGGIHGGNANLRISNCEFVSNRAYQGGGLFAEHGPATISVSNFISNTASSEPNDPNFVTLGSGGGLHLWATEASIIDCSINSNQAEASGGGIYLGGEGAPSLINCLLTNNTAGRDGGGISTNIFSQLTLSNCTIADNIITGIGFEQGYGGGLYCSYESYTDIINSILWGNMANIGAQGSQLAVGTAFKYAPGPSEVNVIYSDIQDVTDPNAFGATVTTLDLVFLIDTTNSMFDDIDAVKAAAEQITNEIATKFADSRIALVSYRNFPDPNIGTENDWPYRDEVSFTTDVDEMIAGIDSLEAGGGAEETIFAALMHCIDANALVERLTNNGRAEFIEQDSPGIGAWRQGNKVMRVIILMGDEPPDDPEIYTDYMLEDVTATATAADIHILPLLIGNNAEAADYFENLAEGTGGVMLQAAGAGEVVERLLEAIDLISVIPDPLLVEAGCTINWDPNSYSWAPGSYNIDEDPRFVSGYYLSQIGAGQPFDSPCVDAGSDLAINLGLDAYTTRTDRIFDKEIVDMGYHYPLAQAESCRVCDLVFDGRINFADFAAFSRWSDQDCSGDSNGCGGADFTFDTRVDFEDLAFFVECWLVEDTEAPIPNPSEWEIEPYSTTDTAPFALAMKAVQAFDAWGWQNLQYQFECTSDPYWSSNWQDEREYEPEGLEPDTEYFFSVRARDSMNNVTKWSVEASAVTGEVQFADDNTPPVPDPMTWFELPAAISDTSIGMIASTATDQSGVEYGFWNITLDPAGTQIDWQDEPNFIDTDLAPDTTYAYRCAARDKSLLSNTTEWSDPPAAATTLPAGTEPDTEPPVTGVHADIYKAAFEDTGGFNPDAVYVSGEGYYHTMTAVAATDATGPVWYKFICTNESSFSSGWQQDPAYTVLVSALQSKDYYMWQVVTRDSVTPVPNEGSLSDYHNCKGDVVPYP